MKKHFLATFIFIASLQAPLLGQFSGKWTPAQTLKKTHRPDKVSISSESDWAVLTKHPAILSDAYSVKTDNISAPVQLLALTQKYPDMAELYLKNSGSLLQEKDFEALVNIEHLILELSAADTGVLEKAWKMPHLEKVTLIFREEPQDWDFLFYYRNLKNLHIYGTFLPETLYEITDKLMVFHHLTELGLSIDFATDLPRNLNLLTQLQFLKLYDNLTRLNYDHQAQIQPERFNINGILGNDQGISLSVLFYSEDFGLTVRENRYMESIWSGKRDAYNPPAESFAGGKGTKDLYLLAPKPVFPPTLNIETLLEDFYPSSEIFEINCKENNIVHTQSGCNIFVPAGSLLRQDGSVFDGKAYVSVRYMQDLADVAFRGLDLRVARYPGSPLYRSDSMFEIEITDGVFPLQFNEAMHIRLDIPVNDTASSFYFYDRETKGFMDYELYKTVFGNSGIPQIPVRYDEWLRQQLAIHTYMLDSRNFNERFKNPETYFLFDKNSKSERYIKEKAHFTYKEYSWEKSTASKKPGYQIKEGRNLLKISKKNPKHKTKNDLFFQILQTNELFSEVSVLKKCLFKFADTLSNKEFSMEFSRNKKYSDFRIEQDKAEGKWYIVMKSDEGYYRIKAEPLLYKRNGKPYKERKSKKILQKFYKEQALRAGSFNHFLEQREADYSRYYQKRQNDWERKDKFRTVFIKSTGIYGFMNIEPKQEENINCFINFLDNNGLPVDVKHVFLLDKTAGTVQRIKPGNIDLNLSTVSLILCSDYKGQLHYIDGDALRSYGLSDGSIYFLRLNSLSHPPRSTTEFKRYIKYDRLK